MSDIDDFTGVWMKQGAAIGGLSGLLQRWTEKSIDYCACHDWEDNGWWYTERASLSILAGAAWCMDGWCAMEEYSSQKHGKPELDRPGERRGRADLWVGNYDTGYALEAKQSWQSIGRRASGKNPDIKSKFDAAWDDAGCLKSDCADYRIAAVFVTACLPVSEVSSLTRRGKPVVDEGAVRVAVTNWLQALDIESDSRVSAYAWVFPARVRDFLSKDGKSLFPGTLLILGERKRARQQKG